jgi:dihydropteroate synthase
MTFMPATWQIHEQTHALASGWIMGVLNVTPDSFSDGGRYFQTDRAVEQALQMLADGADIIDVGGESTRPGAAVATSEDEGRGGETGQSKTPVSEAEELRRVLPVIEAIRHARPDAILSIDTYKAGVARAAVELGAEIVNDVSAFRWDPNMANTVAKLGCGAVLMHMRGRPDQWRHLEPVADIVGLVGRDLRQWAEAALRAGVPQNKIVLDPGFGFGKTVAHNLNLLRHLVAIAALGYPVLAGMSRKATLGFITGRDVGNRLASSIAAAIAAAARVRRYCLRECGALA